MCVCVCVCVCRCVEGTILMGKFVALDFPRPLLLRVSLWPHCARRPREGEDERLCIMAFERGVEFFFSFSRGCGAAIIGSVMRRVRDVCVCVCVCILYCNIVAVE